LIAARLRRAVVITTTVMKLPEGLPKFIEIETSRFCNRKCSWCPNGRYDTRSHQQLMPWELFAGLICELKGLGYRGSIAFHNYNEPLANKRLVREICFVRETLPYCKAVVFTNGDLLTSGLLGTLVSIGLSFLRITLYPEEGVERNERSGSDSATLIRAWLADKKIELPQLNFEDIHQGYAGIAQIGALYIEIIDPYLQTYNWRGGTATSILPVVRCAPCHYTSNLASIDYQGRLKMCCNIFPDAEDHEQYVVGKLGANSFLELWNSTQMASYRRNHARADFADSPACLGCSINNSFSLGELAFALSLAGRKNRLEWGEI
jgi:hypothetical protein